MSILVREKINLGRLLKIKIIIFLLLFFVGIAFAGEVVKFVCDTCGFQSGNLFTGSGTLIKENIVVYCDHCKNFYVITPSAQEIQIATDKILKPKSATEESVFPEGRKKVYSCPNCNSDAVVYENEICPICKKGTLRRQFVGRWD